MQGFVTLATKKKNSPKNWSDTEAFKAIPYFSRTNINDSTKVFMEASVIASLGDLVKVGNFVVTQSDAVDFRNIICYVITLKLASSQNHNTIIGVVKETIQVPKGDYNSEV